MDSEKIKSQIGNNIAAYRKQSNMTQAELAERLNYSDKAVSKWERGESLPDVMTLIQLAQVLGVSVDHLLKRDEAPVAVETPARRATSLMVTFMRDLPFYAKTRFFTQSISLGTV